MEEPVRARSSLRITSSKNSLDYSAGFAEVILVDVLGNLVDAGLELRNVRASICGPAFISEGRDLTEV